MYKEDFLEGWEGCFYKNGPKTVGGRLLNHFCTLLAIKDESS